MNMICFLVFEGGASYDAQVLGGVDSNCIIQPNIQCHFHSICLNFQQSKIFFNSIITLATSPEWFGWENAEARLLQHLPDLVSAS